MMLLRTLLPSGSVYIRPSPTAAAVSPVTKTTALSFRVCLTQDFLPCPTHFLSSILQLSEKVENPENTKLDLFLVPLSQIQRWLQPHKTQQPLPLGSVGSLRYLLSPSILQTCVRHQDVVWKVLRFHQSKIGEGDSTAPARTPAPAHPHEHHQWQQRPHYLSPCLFCFKIATCLTHGVTKPCPGGNSPPFILLLCLLAF